LIHSHLPRQLSSARHGNFFKPVLNKKRKKEEGKKKQTRRKEERKKKTLLIVFFLPVKDIASTNLSGVPFLDESTARNMTEGHL
jgi:hypothetical protein